MNATAERARPLPAASAPSSTPTLRRSLRRSLFWIIATAGALLVAVAATVISGAGVGGRPLAADSPGQAGAMALVEVLRQQGVTVTVAGTVAEARLAADEGTDPTLFLYDDAGHLDADQLDQVAGFATRTVVVDPDFTSLQAITPEVGFGGVSDAESLSADCDLPAAARARTLSPGGKTLTIADSTPRDGVALTGCFPSGRGAYSVIERTASGRTVTLVPDADLFDNEHVATFGNAALALNLLGESDSLVWYLPTLGDVARTGPPSLAELTPGWVTPVLALLVLVAIAAFVWRGRRFGPLVGENLPVTVKAGETMEGRARLYARGNARLRAIDALRVGAIDRLSGQLGLGRRARLEEVVLGVASATGRPPDQVRAVLVDAVPGTDRDLVELSDRLSELVRATIHAVAPPGSAPLPPPTAHPEQPGQQHGRMDQ